MKPPFIHDNAIARRANELVRAHQRKCPAFALPYDLHGLIWEHLYEMEGLRLEEDEELGSVDGELILGATVLEKKTIYIAPALKGQPNYRFTLAHELGHWVLHCRPSLTVEGQEVLELFDSAEEAEQRPDKFTTLYRAITEAPNVVRDPYEIQANKFAAHLLMPAHEVRQRYLARYSSPTTVPEASALHVAARRVASEVTAGFTTPLRAEFDVSIDAMAYRLEDLGLVSVAGRFFEEG